MKPTKLSRLRDAAGRFRCDMGGNFAITFALLIVPIMGTVSAAVDYSMMVRIKTNLQGAVDGSVLAAAKSFSTTFNYNDLDTIGKDYFDGNFSGTNLVSGVTYSLTYGASNDLNTSGETTGLRLTATATGTYRLHFGQFVGMEQNTIVARASVNISSATIEAAFVFDASGSMTDNDVFEKSTNAAHDLLHNMKQYALAMSQATKANTEYARYALVPFAWGVNVGTGKAAATWMDTLGEADHHHDHIDWSQGWAGATKTGYGWKSGTKWLTRSTLNSAINDSWTGCVEARAYPYFLDDTAPDILSPDTLFVPHFYPDEPTNLVSGERTFKNEYLVDNVSGATSKITLNGSNSGSEAKQILRQPWTSKYNKWATVSQYAKDGLGPNRNCFDYPLYQLNGEFAQTNSQIANLKVTYSKTHSLGTGDDDGATNIQQGMVWGWHLLSEKAPYTQGRPDDDIKNRKVVILITDGINSYGVDASQNGSQYGAFGFVEDGRIEEGIGAPGGMSVRDMLDEHTLATCTNMKAAGIEIFAVGYGVTAGSREETLLKNCSGGDVGYQYYFGVEDTSIEPALTSILYQLIDLRLTI